MTKLQHLNHALNSTNRFCRYTLSYRPAIHCHDHLLHRRCEPQVEQQQQEAKGSASSHREESQSLRTQHICSSGPAGSRAPALCPAALRAADAANQGRDLPLHHHRRSITAPASRGETPCALRFVLTADTGCWHVPASLRSTEIQRNCTRMRTVRCGKRR